MIDIEFVRSRFIKHFDGKTGNVYTSPGRINLIGEHTDYNGGFVFPGAVDKGITAEMRVNGTEDTVMAYAIDLKDRVDFHLNDPAGPRPLGHATSTALPRSSRSSALTSRASTSPSLATCPSVPVCLQVPLWRAALPAV